MSAWGESWGSAWGESWGAIDSGKPGGVLNKGDDNRYEFGPVHMKRLHDDDETLIFAIAALVASGRLH